jgi:hypothetical protein
MPGKRIEVTTYSGFRAEETPRSFTLNNAIIEVNEILSTWVEEGLRDRSRKRFFKVKGSDGNIHTLYYDEIAMEWFYR